MKKDVFNSMMTVFLLTAGPAIAQDSLKKDSVKVITEVTVTATRSEKNIFDVGRSVNLITNDDLKDGQYHNLADVLSQQEGVYMVGTGQNYGGTQSLFLRGANSNQNVIMVDGIRITDPSAVNNSPDFSEFTLTNIERIEVVRGSHSTMYGSSAIGGVVNMITKKNMSPGFHIDAMALGGIYGMGAGVNGQNVFLDYTFKNGFYANGELNVFTSGGQDATVDTNSNPGGSPKRDNDGFAKKDYVGKIGYHKEKLDVYFSYRNTSMLKEIDKRAYKDDENYTLDFKRSLFTYGASYKYNDHLSFSFIGGFSNMERKTVDDSSVVDTSGNYDGSVSKATYTGSHSTNELQMNWKVKGFELLVGGGTATEHMSDTTYDYVRSFNYTGGGSLDSLNLMTNTNNFFAHVDIGGVLLSEKLSGLNLSLGTRFTDHSSFGPHSTFDINPSYKLTENGLLFGSYSTGFNAPSLYQLYAPDKYYTWDFNYTTGLTRGNPNLKPEKSNTIEVGFKQKVSEKVSFSIAVFSTEVQHVIEYVYLWDKNIGVDTMNQNWGRDDYRGDTYVNLGTSKTKGVEIGMHSKLNEHFSVSGNLSLVSGRLVYDPNGIDTTQTSGERVQLYSNGAYMENKKVEIIGLVRRPPTANLSLSWMPIKTLMLRTDLRYVGARADIYYETGILPFGALATAPVGDYMLMGLSVKYNFSKNISAGVKCENLLDQKYYEINGFTTRGRGVYINLRVSF